MLYFDIVLLILLMFLSYKLWTLVQKEKEGFVIPPRHKIQKPNIRKPNMDMKMKKPTLGLFKSLFSGLKNLVKGFFKLIKYILIALIYNPIVDFINATLSFILNLPTFVINLFQNIFQIVARIIAGIIAKIIKLFKQFFYMLKTVAINVLEFPLTIFDMLSQMITIIQNFFIMIIQLPQTILNMIIGLQTQELELKNKTFTLPFVGWFFK